MDEEMQDELEQRQERTMASYTRSFTVCFQGFSFRTSVLISSSSANEPRDSVKSHREEDQIS
jgi:hypothetical protein